MDKPTEVTVLAPQISKCKTNLVYSPLPLPLQRPLTSEKGIFVDSPDFILPSPLESKSRSLDLLKYLVSDILAPKKTLICPYCSNEIKIVPTIVRHPYDICNQDPIIEKISCPYTAPSGRNIEGLWIPKPLEPRCPYCAKYRGELNQLA
ncbi:hypothetical protein WA026_002543 [Henosepilachna vigintioctopunctata]|uniref:Uncharacterized protein n=1 Tax=Henosepilachna vigintioctopunctata TaxID=420089 RepID=A0AAW1U114_9CUCU